MNTNYKPAPGNTPKEQWKNIPDDVIEISLDYEGKVRMSRYADGWEPGEAGRMYPDQLAALGLIPYLPTTDAVEIPAEEADLLIGWRGRTLEWLDGDEWRPTRCRPDPMRPQDRFRIPACPPATKQVRLEGASGLSSPIVVGSHGAGMTITAERVFVDGVEVKP